MITWFTENLATIIISMVLMGIVAGIITNLVKKKKRGEPSCGCDCGDCGGCTLKSDSGHNDQ